MDRAGGGVTSAVGIPQLKLFAFDHRLLDTVEERRPNMCRGCAAVAPRSRLDQHRVARCFSLASHRFGHCLQQLAHGDVHRRGRSCSRSGHEEQRPCLGSGQTGQVSLRSAHQLPPAVATLAGVQRHTSYRQCVEVTAGGALGNLQFVGYLSSSDTSAGLQQQQDAEQSVGTHISYSTF